MRYIALNTTFKRCFYSTPIEAAKKVALSKFEPNQYIPYEKLNSNLSVVRKR